MRGSLGVYFGSKIITIIEASGRKILNNTQISRSALSGSELEEKVPDEVKIVALFKDEFRKSKIQSKEMTLGLSGRDLIIRSFELPHLPPDELANAVNYEAKKYIPFKVEDLVSSYQIQYDKASKKNLVLFVGIKKETLNKYMAIFNELSIKVSAIEYSVFGILRFLQLTDFGKAGNKGVISVINMDFQEENEVNFLVLENGFPLFSRDITLIGRPEEPEQADKPDFTAVLEKLKTEIRISLDYYDRKFPSKNIEKMFITSGEAYRVELETLLKDIGLSVKFVETSRYMGKVMPFSMSFIKGYGCALARAIRIVPRIDLLAAHTKSKFAVNLQPDFSKFTQSSLLAGLKVDPRVAVLCVLFCALVFGFGLYRVQPAKKEYADLRDKTPRLPMVNPDSGLTELNNLSAEYKNTLTDMYKLVKQRMYLTAQLQVIPALVPDGVWLTDFAFSNQNNKRQLNFTGMAYLGEGDKEFIAVNKMITDLKSNKVFSEYFSEISVTSLNRNSFGKGEATSFAVVCQGG
jgi:type IV pilus assembly protein PilM